MKTMTKAIDINDICNSNWSCY